jgi:membrane-associated phospholipid phosphatase
VTRPVTPLVFAATGLALIAVTVPVAATGRVGTVERWVFARINGLPDVLEWPMWTFQLAGLLLIPLAVALLAVWWRRWWLAAALVTLIPLKLLVEKGVLKQLVDRQRPGRTEPDPILRDVPSVGASFPSGHAIIAFGIATLLTPYLGRTGRVVVWTLAVLNSVARVYLGAHNPLDVVCGAGAGLLLGGVLTWIVGVPTKREGVRT